MLYEIDQRPESISVTMEGDFTFNDSDVFVQIVRCIKPANDTPRSTIRFNVERLEKIDAAALGMLLEILDTTKQNHQNMTIEKARGQVAQKLKMAAQYNHGLMIAQ